jgi:3-hydroxyisobutyrate dehydrogenase-like beta-hydroxyacid dehydrogenase
LEDALEFGSANRHREDIMKVAFIGLGSMGAPMARNLFGTGHELVVYNRTRSAAEPLEREGARVAASPREAAEGVEVLVTMLADDSAVEAVIFGDGGAIEGLPRGAVHASMSTISPALSRRLAAEHGTRGQLYVAAPVFGRPDAAAAAKLTIVAAGPADAIERCRPLFEALSQAVETLGDDPPKANVVKLGGNFLLASAIEALGEAFSLVRKHGIDPTRFLQIVNGRLVRSPVYENYGTIIVQERFEPPGFKLVHGLKDVRLALDAAGEVDAPLPIAGVLRDHYLSAIAWGWGDMDWAGVAKVSAVEAGLDRR